MLGSIRDRLKKPRRRKHDAEMAFWRERHAEAGGQLASHPRQPYCDWFDLTAGFYDGKRVLDVGCGPRGTLEWADMAAERVGLDPLVSRYRELGIDEHAMTYVEAGAESMPFEDGRFDIVVSLNSLDHVDDLDAAVGEIARVTSPGGTWLVVVEAEAPPTATEPQTIPWEFLERLSGWRIEWSRRVALSEHDIYGSLAANEAWAAGPGLLVGRLTRI